MDAPFASTARRCHEVSLAIVKAGVLERPARVARGVCRGVTSQHSWIVVGDDCYAPNAQIIDPALWSYAPEVTGVWHGTARSRYRHTPHGAGSIWSYGRPERARHPADVVLLTPTFELSRDAQTFLAILGGLDRRGWLLLADAPVGGWPAGEILAAMDDTPQLSALVPIDKLGMLTDRNPGRLYLPD